MYLWKFVRAEIGKRLSSRSINVPQFALEQLARISATPPIAIQIQGGLPIIYWAGPLINIVPALVTTTIPAASVTGGVVTPGTGNVDLQYRDPLKKDYESTSQRVPVYNLATKSVTPGLVQVYQDSSGDWTLLAGTSGGLTAATPLSGIPAGNLSAPAVGSATLLVQKPSSPGWTILGGTIVSAYNPFSQAVPASAFMWLTLTPNGFYEVVSFNCGAS